MQALHLSNRDAPEFCFMLTQCICGAWGVGGEWGVKGVGEGDAASAEESETLHFSLLTKGPPNGSSGPPTRRRDAAAGALLKKPCNHTHLRASRAASRVRFRSRVMRRKRRPSFKKKKKKKGGKATASPRRHDTAGIQVITSDDHETPAGWALNDNKEK